MSEAFALSIVPVIVTILFWAAYFHLWQVGILACLMILAYIIVHDILYPPPPRTTISEIYHKLQHKCKSLRGIPVFAALPRDILHNYITPMVNNIDRRTVFAPDRYCFADASVQYREDDPFSPLGIRVRGPIPVPIPNPVDECYEDLQSKGVINGEEYLGGTVFAVGNNLYHLLDRELYRLPIRGVKDIIIMRRLVVAAHESGYTFLSPTNLRSVTIEASQLPELDQRFLKSQFAL